MNTNHTALIRSITRGVWFMEPSQEGYLHLAIKAMKGELPEQRDDRPAVTYYHADGSHYEKFLQPQSNILAISDTAQLSADRSDKELIAVYSVHGVITKYDQWCGPQGMLSLIENMRANDRDSRVIAHVLDIDSGGGEASIIDTIASEIHNLEKPVLSYFNSVAASAAYYIAAATTEIYASEPTDIVGSIGTMVTFADFRAHFEKEGIKIHEIYADQSKLKNKDFHDAREGKYDAVKKTMLNPYADAFISAVKKYRPQLEEETAYQGAVFTAKDAVAIGMIDGIKSFSRVLERAKELGRSKQTQAPNQNTQTMKLSNLLTVLGLSMIEFQDGYASFSQEQVEAIETELTALMEDKPQAQAAQEAAQAQEAEHNTQISDLQASVQTLTGLVNAQQAAIEKIAGTPAASQTQVNADKELPAESGSPELQSARQALEEFNKSAEATAKSGAYAFTQE